MDDGNLDIHPRGPFLRSIAPAVTTSATLQPIAEQVDFHKYFFDRPCCVPIIRRVPKPRPIQRHFIATRSMRRDGRKVGFDAPRRA
jgi:hypothetical protein